MKDFNGIYNCLNNIEQVKGEFNMLQDDYMSICETLAEGHEARSIEWYQSVDCEDSIKIEEYHNHLKAALRELEAAQDVLMATNIARVIELNDEIKIYEDEDNPLYATPEYKAFLKKREFPTIIVKELVWDEETEREVRLFHINSSELKKYTDEKVLYDHLKENCVGKCNTLCGTDEYFIPCIEIGGLKLSVQVNYRIWSWRDDRYGWKSDKHKEMITEEEFDACIDMDTCLDLLISYEDSRLMCGQASILNICCFLARLYHTGEVTIDCDCI